MKFSGEVIQKFLTYTEKERTLKQVCDHLKMSELEVMGLVSYMKSNGVNIATKNKTKTISMINKGDLMYPESKVQQFYSGEDNEFKFIVIADTRLGSKYQQLSTLNSIYRKGYEEGYHHVFLCGNISAGVYNLKDDRSDMNFINDAYEQIDYIVKYYPQVEGIKTYLVNGKTDYKHLKKNITSIGKKLAEGRDDFVYLGNLSANVKIDNVNMQILAPTLSKTYTVSYRPQQQIDSYRSEDKPDILLMGGYLQMEKFTYRGVTEISVPSVCATTPKMNDRRYSNTVGTWYVTVKTDEKGNLKNVIAMNSPYYLTGKNDYKVAKVLKKVMKKGDDHNV